MLEEYSRIYSTSEFDFRKYANRHDPLSHLFPQWVEYYRTKWAISRWLQPTSILEIGVRYGYSAISFLDACPDATYLGIDNDSEQSGGVRGAKDWAVKITEGYHADFLLADTCKLNALPGGHYDLIHVDGAQFGDSTYHDLELALEKSRYILLDGVFWTSTNNMAASAFLKDYRNKISFATYLPGYAGELLIRTKNDHELATPQHNSTDLHSASIRDEYNKSYYLEDCGGYDNYLCDQGRIIGDARLSACVSLINPAVDKTILDVGCGRGEIAFACATHQATVDAVDYSAAAIELSRSTFANTPESAHINLHQTDIASFNSGDKKYDAMVAADFVEHVSPAELDSFFAWASNQLTTTGQLIVHTFPNLWFYKYEYARRRRIVAREGGYLSPNPRTDYEKQMHINELTPSVLNRQLKQSFEHVLLWLASDDDPIFSLRNKLTPRQASRCPSIFAIASNSNIDRAVVTSRFSQDPIEPSHLCRLLIEADLDAMQASPGETKILRVNLTNLTGLTLTSNAPFPVHLSYHIRHGAECVVFEGERSKLNGEIQVGASAACYMRVKAPLIAGEYALDVTAVQENVAWIDQIKPEAVATITLLVA